MAEVDELEVPEIEPATETKPSGKSGKKKSNIKI